MTERSWPQLPPDESPEATAEANMSDKGPPADAPEVELEEDDD